MGTTLRTCCLFPITYQRLGFTSDGRRQRERGCETTSSGGAPPPQRPTQLGMRSTREERTDPSDDAAARKGASVPNQTCACGIDHSVTLEVQIQRRCQVGKRERVIPAVHSSHSWMPANKAGTGSQIQRFQTVVSGGKT